MAFIMRAFTIVSNDRVMESMNRMEQVPPSSSGFSDNPNINLVERVYDEVLRPLDSGAVDRLFLPDYIQHSPLAPSGAQALKEFLDWAKRTSPQAQHLVKRIFADGDYVIAHVHVVINPGDRGNAVIDIFRIQNGMIAEHWDVSQPVPATSLNDNGMF
ncbi:nuclear transport factor 2 family protein [Rhizorhapis suberifaciens]|uniref:Putative SnoaL-like aldol condensation-catalyzing enzyme n=1 Tax=Rhizorhapis suberifaciens TaxID=13656 RepID=A0A840HS56_9SPHN|nr:nuclear transport factor 2 family protein [Rhizorhapis suberifaciens]MBB4640541.1 putative SnoaL-like aldol condensation-catalyzing enzyme [Rhizorhapis suberifaciens]